jgi:hypothetical protein
VLAASLLLAACSSEPEDAATTPVPAVRSSSSLVDSTTATTPLPVFTSAIRLIDESTQERMASSWRSGCPVPLQDLRLVNVSHWGFDGAARTGEIVIHADFATEAVSAFDALFMARFPVEQMRLVDDFGGDDDRSMAANNTSGFNCRAATGSDGWSEHAYGRAIDINPIQNPFVTASGSVLPPAGEAHLDRDAAEPGLITRDGPVVAAFAAVGWRWGGDWVSGQDYQHFSATGR